MDEDGPINSLYAPKGLFPRLTGPDSPFEEALGWLQFVYTADRAGDYVAPVSKVLTHSTVAEGGELFPEILSHLRRLYPEVYGPAVSLCQAPERREFPLQEEELLSGGTSNFTSFS